MSFTPAVVTLSFARVLCLWESTYQDQQTYPLLPFCPLLIPDFCIPTCAPSLFPSLHTDFPVTHDSPIPSPPTVAPGHC